jgi:hypothetical protein
MMMTPGCVDALKVVAAELPVASFLFNFARGFNTRLRIRQNPTVLPVVFCRRPSICPPALAPSTRFHYFLDLDTSLW